MAAPTLSMQANWSLGADHLMSTTWDADLPDLTLHGEQHSPSSGMGETDYLSLLEQTIMEEGQGLSSFPADDLCFPNADVPFCSPNLDDHGIDVRLPHPDTLKRDRQLRGLAPTHQGLINIEQRMLPPIAIRQQHSHSHHVLELDFASHHREQRSSEARARPHTALPAVHTGRVSNAMHMPVIPERLNSMHRTRSCPSNGRKYPLPAHFANGASPHEAQSNRPPSFHPGRAPEPEYRHREAALEDDPASPPRRKGKGGRQRAPAPDATVDPKRAKRIMANRASAAKSKEKQKQKVMELEDKKEAKRAQIAAMQHANAKRQAACNLLRDRLVELDGLEKEYKRLLDLNSKLTDFQRVLRDAMGASERTSWTPSGINCLPQTAYSEAPVKVHAFSSNTMLSGPPAFKGTPGGPETPDLDRYVGSLPQLSDSYEQILCEGSTSPPDLHPGSVRSAH